MTLARKKILAYVRSRCTPPTFREIGLAVGIKSTGTIAYHLARLRDLGLVEWSYATRRSVKAT